LNPIHLLSSILIAGGFILLASAWRVLFEAQRTHHLALAGPYARLRHPQYVAFVLILLGFLLQWPTLLTMAMFPILVAMYVRLARREEAEVLAEFGATYRRYMARTPAFIPRFGGPAAEREGAEKMASRR
jgi:protein-S-isoprenylcysteine O-methyltransferase Ste14